jgi:PAS domain-containing protein
MDAQIEALQASEHTLAAAARLANLGYWEIDAAGQRVSWSEGGCRILGLPLTDRTRSWEGFISLVHAEDRAGVEECRARMLRGEDNFPVVFRLALPDAGVRYAGGIGRTVPGSQRSDGSHGRRRPGHLG